MPKSIRCARSASACERFSSLHLHQAREEKRSYVTRVPVSLPLPPGTKRTKRRLRRGRCGKNRYCTRYCGGPLLGGGRHGSNLCDAQAGDIRDDRCLASDEYHGACPVRDYRLYKAFAFHGGLHPERWPGSSDWDYGGRWLLLAV